MTTTKEAAPFINPENEYFLGLSMEQRRKLPFGPSCISQADRYYAEQRKTAAEKPAQPPAPSIPK